VREMADIENIDGTLISENTDDFKKLFENLLNTKLIHMQQFLDRLQDINHVFYYLRGIISEIDVCDNNNCIVFPKMLDLDLLRMNILLKDYPNPELALLIQNDNEKTDWKKQYFHFIYLSKEIMNLVFAFYSTNKTIQAKIDKRHKAFIEIIDHMVKSNQSFPVDFQKSVQSDIDHYNVTLQMDDPRVVKERDDFKKQQQAQMKEDNSK